MSIDIKELRKRLGQDGCPISQAELGKMLGGINQATVSRMERDPSQQSGPVAVLLEQLYASTQQAAA